MIEIFVYLSPLLHFAVLLLIAHRLSQIRDAIRWKI